jgi:hypothetical protein
MIRPPFLRQVQVSWMHLRFGVLALTIPGDAE